MSRAEHPVEQDVTIGPAVVTVPGDWRVVESGAEGLVVLRAPLDADPALETLQQTPGFVHPNLVLSYREAPAEQGGVARTAGDELRGALHVAPGSTLLAATAFRTADGLPGRAHVVAALKDRTPFQSSRWYVGLGDVVVEIVLTLPASPQPDLLRLGESVAGSVRPDPKRQPASEQRGLSDRSQPTIPERRVDRVLLHRLAQEELPDALTRLEDIAEIIADLPTGLLPGAPAELSAEAIERLLETAQLGSTTRFSGTTAPEVRELRDRGLMDGDDLSGLGARMLSGVESEPDLVLSGRSVGGTARVRVWIDGTEATLVLEPALAQQDRTGTQGHHLMRELAISVPAVLMAWAGQQSGWFVDVTADLEADALEELTSTAGAVPQAGIRCAPEDEEFIRDALGGAVTHWSAILGATGGGVSWLQTAQRGPLMIGRGDDADTVRLSSTTASVVYDQLMTLTRSVSG